MEERSARCAIALTLAVAIAGAGCGRAAARQSEVKTCPATLTQPRPEACTQQLMRKARSSGNSPSNSSERRQHAPA